MKVSTGSLFVYATLVVLSGILQVYSYQNPDMNTLLKYSLQAILVITALIYGFFDRDGE
ncbi:MULTISPECIES: hypothetical protein [Bacillus cereus group]|uniref:Group-specific protein n=1 Tax=Bacillus cereus TaxID=1396 RepID=A0AAW5L9F2_BACCE|nr:MULTISPECIES: hypothetical protein [Bacillus cereus group]MCQ6289083.1 hypothetical protein [Bacillus cereus]MCQ6307405.1 hypothetical protein [Bacillus cereus]MCQ6318568.1 hypothetical protein [Bacillus cereus]MCQ6330850.1 hypothetical protein [Bacillus cereus]MCQ6386118.1 hypothetical protein [Bacillus cereus]